MGFFCYGRPRSAKGICRFRKDKNIVDLHAKNGSEDHEIINRGHSGALLPLIDGLGRGKAEGILQIFDGVSQFGPQRRNIFARFDHIDGGFPVHFYPFRQLGQRSRLQFALKIIDGFHNIDDVHGIRITSMISPIDLYAMGGFIDSGFADRGCIDALHRPPVFLHIQLLPGFFSDIILPAPWGAE